MAVEGGSAPAAGRISLRGLIVIVVGGLALVLGIPLVLGWASGGQLTETTQIFVAAVALIVVLGALAALSSYLNITSARDAFGLPSGTVRAVLALGLLIAFVVFGIGELDRLSKAQFTSTTISVDNASLMGAGHTGDNPAPNADEIAAKSRSFEQLGFIVLGTHVDGQNTTFQVLQGANPGYLAFSRDLLTLLGTLLTSILAFYFGSRAAERKSEKDQEDETVPQGTSVSKGGASVVVTSKGISFGPNQINDSAAGLGGFTKGDQVKISGAAGANKDKTVTVKEVMDGSLIVNEPLAVIAVPADGSEITLTKL